ncbi:MAG: oligosaccharide flippase family protein [Methanobrevibacter sp.]|jgi:O-antigen/teichoic acid export membrane protein|nr:oligosaccharide flippase family protein [Candidatus Methanovirga aequatorialis]
MSLIRDLFKNTGVLTISQITTSIMAFFWTTLYANYLGVGDYGTINFAIATMGIITIFMDFGMNIYIVRDVSRNKQVANVYLGNIIPLKILLSSVTVLSASVILKLMNYPNLVILISIIFGIQTAIMNMNSLFNGIFQAFHKMKYQAIGSIINSTLLLSFVIVAVKLDLGITSIALAYLTSITLTTIYLVKTLKKLVNNIKIRFDFKFWLEVMKKATPFGITSIFTSIFFMTDQVMLGAISGDYALGIYSASYRILTVFITLYTMYTTAVFPFMSNLYKKSDNILKITYEKSVKYLLALALPICVGTSFYADDIATLIFEPEYVMVGSLLPILIWNIVFTFVNGISDSLLNSTNHEVGVTKRTGIAGVFNFVLNLILISKFSYYGATISTLLSGLLVLILNNYLISRALFKINSSLIVDIIKISISAAILAIVLYFIHVSMWMAIPVGMITYGMAIIITKVLDDDDKYIVKELLKK